MYEICTFVAHIFMCYVYLLLMSLAYIYAFDNDTMMMMWVMKDSFVVPSVNYVDLER